MFPRLHAMIVHFPIAFLLGGSLAALAYLLYRPRHDLRVLAWWLLAVGWVGTAAAVLSGLLAQSNLPPDAPYRGRLNLHITGGFALLVVYGDLLYRGWLHTTKRRRLHARENAPHRPPDVDFWDLPGRRAWLVAQLLLGVAILAFTGWLGGELVYAWGVGVD